MKDSKRQQRVLHGSSKFAYQNEGRFLFSEWTNAKIDMFYSLIGVILHGLDLYLGQTFRHVMVGKAQVCSITLIMAAFLFGEALLLCILSHWNSLLRDLMQLSHHVFIINYT